MKCIHCHKEIDEYKERYEIHGYDGDFIHVNCKEGFQEQLDKVCNMTNDEFASWMLCGGE